MKNKDFALTTLVENFQALYSLSVHTFGIIFFYQLFGNNAFLAFLPIILRYFFLAVLIPYSSWIAGKIGTSKSLLLAVFLYIFSSLPLLLFQYVPNNFLVLSWLLLFILGDLFYNPARIYLYGQNSTHNNRGTTFAFKHITLTITKILTPLVSGYIIETFGFSRMIVLSALVASLSIVPIMMLHNLKFNVMLQNHSWFTNPSVKKLTLVNSIGRFGDHAGQTIWVLYLYFLFGQSTSNVGTLFTFTTAISIAFLYVFGLFLNKHNRIKSFKGTSLLYALTNILRALPISPIILDTCNKVVNQFRGEVAEVINYDFMNDNVKNKDKDEMMVIREIGLNLNIVISYLVGGLLLYFLDFQLTFISLGVIMAALSLLVKD
ncbi:hypothetical protein KC717_05050 [Candidatus Dojkabacteria bacterium]|uniref:MFS transporter n=1 Tax=Candidatus Dojkabacteria bacterium TaxID=2099670 RepID=A0A955L9H5_9BACT|nr:hypothetical protein [Candidatus Dojkabacteria bacterium]